MTETEATVLKKLKRLYKEHLLDLETTYKFHRFHSPKLDEGYFDAKPMVLLLGQYSVGKSTFIRYMLGEDYPDIRIGEEPTTENFIAIMHSDTSRTIPGNALANDPAAPFKPLQKFGNSFLSRFNAACLPNKLLEKVSFIDTPGILSGEKQRIDRGYDFPEVLDWFAEHVDVIVLMFDAHKLDISDEFKSVIEVVRKYKEKVRIVLNKADQFDSQKLLRIFGALMWSLGKVMATPEVPRVYVGSFWDQKREKNDNSVLFEREEGDLLQELESLPIRAPLRKLNDFIRRAALAKVHALIMSQLYSEMPMLFGKDSAKQKLIDNLSEVYTKVQQKYDVPAGDFPDVERMKKLLQEFDFSQLPSYKEKLIKKTEKYVKDDIPKLIEQVSAEVSSAQLIASNIFSVENYEGFNAGKNEPDVWIVEQHRARYDSVFKTLKPDEQGKVSIAEASAQMKKSNLSNHVLKKIWYLGDVDKDDKLDIDEWALVNYIIELKLAGHDVPQTLPEHLLPPSKRKKPETD